MAHRPFDFLGLGDGDGGVALRLEELGTFDGEAFADDEVEALEGEADLDLEARKLALFASDLRFWKKPSSGSGSHHVTPSQARFTR